MVNVISNKAILANLSSNSWGVHRTHPDATDEVLAKHNADKNSGSFKKRLLNRNATKDIRSIKVAARTYHNTQTLPWMDDGTRILPNIKHMEYSSKMHEFHNLFDQAVDAFVKEYPKHVVQAKKELGSLFDAKDYPPAASLRKEYNLRTVFIPWPTKEDFRGDLDDNILKEIGVVLDNRLEEVLQASMVDIATRVTDVVGHMAERLKKYKPGDVTKGVKREGKFHDSMVGHVRELADLLPGFNLTNSPKITAITNNIRTKLAPHDPDVLRDVEKVRKQVIKDADAILKQVKEFLI